MKRKRHWDICGAWWRRGTSESSTDQADTMLRALDWYSDWEGTFRTLKHVRNVLVLVGFFLTAVWASGGDPIKAIIGLLK